MLVLGAVGLAYGFIMFDASTSFNGAKRFPLLFGAGAEGSRGMLTAIAGSMLTVAALVFSLTLSTISQVSSQYSPRVLRNFTRDRGNQVVMGYFVGVFTYCLIVLGTIRGTEEQKFVPSSAVLLGLLLALGGVVALIYFIHHIAESLQTGTILQRISTETHQAMDALFPTELGEPATPAASVAECLVFATAATWQVVRATDVGYVQQVDAEQLLRWAEENRALMRVEQPVGAFISETTPLLRVRAEADNGQDFAPADLQKLTSFINIARHRNIEQDVAFGLQQLVDIALKALSPGINDTTTAIMAIDHLGVACQRLAGRTFPARLRSDGKRPRVLVKAQDFTEYLQLAFDLVRRNAKGNHAVLRRLLRALAQTAETANTPERQEQVSEQAQLLLEYAQQTLETAYEKQSVHALYTELHPTLSPEHTSATAHTNAT